MSHFGITWLVLGAVCALTLFVWRRNHSSDVSLREFLHLPTRAWIAALSTLGFAQGILWLIDTSSLDFLQFHNEVDGQVVVGLLVLITTRLAIACMGAAQPTFAARVVGVLLALLGGILGTMLIGFIDDEMLDDSLDFNDQFDGNLVLAAGLSAIAWMIMRRILTTLPSGILVAIASGIFIGFIAHEILWVMQNYAVFGSIGASDLATRIGIDVALISAVTVATMHRSYRRTPTPVSAQDHTSLLVAALRGRAEIHIFTARIALVLTFCTLAFAMIIFVLAGSITAKESGERIVARSSFLGAELTQALARALAPLPQEQQHELNLRFLSTAPGKWGTEIWDMVRRLDMQGKYDVQLLIALDQIALRIEREGEVSQVKMELMSKQSESVSSAGEATSSNLDELVASIPALMTRLTVAALALFLTQILVSLYRYSSRMAAFCHGRADALVAAQSQESHSFQEYVGAFSAEAVNFGQMPSSPFDQVAEATVRLLKTGWKPPAQ